MNQKEKENILANVHKKMFNQGGNQVKLIRVGDLITILNSQLESECWSRAMHYGDGRQVCMHEDCPECSNSQPESEGVIVDGLQTLEAMEAKPESACLGGCNDIMVRQGCPVHDIEETDKEITERVIGLYQDSLAKITTDDVILKFRHAEEIKNWIKGDE